MADKPSLSVLTPVTPDLERLLKIGAMTGQVVHTNDPDTDVIIVPDGFKVERLHLDPVNPRFIQQVVNMVDVESFCEYVNERKTEQTRIFVNETSTGATYTALIDYHDKAGVAAWKKHRCILELRHSKDFAEFKKNSGCSMGQSPFAEFIEDHSHCFYMPTAAEMIEIAITLEAAKSANFRSAVRISNGTVQFKFEETLAAKAGEKGQLEVPESFSLMLVPFKGGADASMRAMLRYRIGSDGSLTFHYKLMDVQRTIDYAIEATTSKIRDDIGLPVFFGIADD